MPERAADWSHASVDESLTLTVPLTGSADENWLRAFKAVSDKAGFVEGTTPPRCHAEITKDGSAVVVKDVSEGLEDAIRAHVNEVVESANHRAVNLRQAADDNREQRRHSAEERAASAARMTERFKN